MGVKKENFIQYSQGIREIANLRQIYLPREEYALVMSEFNTHMSDEDRKHRLVTKAIGNFYYTIINYGFDNYIVVGKSAIDDRLEPLWEGKE